MYFHVPLKEAAILKRQQKICNLNFSRASLRENIFRHFIQICIKSQMPYRNLCPICSSMSLAKAWHQAACYNTSHDVCPIRIPVLHMWPNSCTSLSKMLWIFVMCIFMSHIYFYTNSYQKENKCPGRSVLNLEFKFICVIFSATLGEQYNMWSFSVWTLFNFCVACSLLIIHSALFLPRFWIHVDHTEWGQVLDLSC
jgi:hypothetical protein